VYFAFERYAFKWFGSDLRFFDLVTVLPVRILIDELVVRAKVIGEFLISVVLLF